MGEDGNNIEPQPGEPGRAGLWLAGFALAAALTGYLIYHAHQGALLRETEELLGSVSRLKAEDVARWRQERQGDLLALSRSPLMLAALKSGLAGGPGREALSERLQRFIEAKHYGAGEIVLPSGELLARTGDSHHLSPEELRPLIAGLKGESDALLGDLFFCPVHNKVHMRMASGFFAGKRLLAALVLRREPEEYLFPSVQEWPGVSETAETLLVEERGGRVLFLNDLRHRKDAALRFTAELRPDLPAARAVQGREGFFIGRDYRGVAVYSYTRSIPDSPWSLVAKVDAAEVDGKARGGLLLSLVTALLVLGAGAYGAYGLVGRHREESRRLSARYAGALADSADTMTLVELGSRRLVESNAACRSMYGYSRAEFLALRADDLRPPELRAGVAPLFARLTEEKNITLRTVHAKKDGTRFPVEIVLRLVELEGRAYAHAVIRDVSEPERRRAAETRLAAALESMTDAVFISDTNGNFVEFNEAFATFHKFKSKADCARTLAEYPAFLEVSLPDGSPAPLEQWAVPRALRGETVTGAEYGLKRKDTGEAWTGSYSFAPIRDRAGSIVGSVVVARDITEKKRAEAQILKLNAALLEKNKEMEDFLYVTTHDLRSPLVNIQGFSENLAAYAEELKKGLAGTDAGGRFEPLLTQKIPGALNYITESAARMDRLIKTLLQVSRAGRSAARKERVEVGPLLAQIGSYFSFALQKGGGRLEIGPLPPCTGDRDQLNQIFSNLVDNAVKYRDKGRPLLIKITGRALDGRAEYEVSDNGIGMEPEQLEKIWQLFYRISATSGVPGEGLGLPLVKLLAEKNGGTVSAASTPGAGSVFRVALPAA